METTTIFVTSGPGVSLGGVTNGKGASLPVRPRLVALHLDALRLDVPRPDASGVDQHPLGSTSGAAPA